MTISCVVTHFFRIVQLKSLRDRETKLIKKYHR